MKFLIFVISNLLLVSCRTASPLTGPRRFVPQSPSPSPNLNPNQPCVVDPLTDASLSAQTHMLPFLYISGLVLLICFIPYLYIKLSPYVVSSYHYSKTKLTDLYRSKIKKT
jgi:hypothetical protein